MGDHDAARHDDSDAREDRRKAAQRAGGGVAASATLDDRVALALATEEAATLHLLHRERLYDANTVECFVQAGVERGPSLHELALALRLLARCPHADERWQWGEREHDEGEPPFHPEERNRREEE